MPLSTAAVNFLDLALRQGRERFVVDAPYFYLLGAGSYIRPDVLQKTGILPPNGPGGRDATGRHRLVTDELSGPTVYAIRKTQASFPSMVTVGRTANNDIVIPDVNVSKFHAYFRVLPRGLELTDAGSRNGTFVGATQLKSQGPPATVKPGESVKFAGLRFVLVDAGTLWDRIHASP